MFGLGFRDLGFRGRVWGVWFRVQGFRVQGFRVGGLGLGIYASPDCWTVDCVLAALTKLGTASLWVTSPMSNILLWLVLV